ncbi:MAG: spore coat U domain-containing protein [Rickettsiella sp.]|nr:spore coat U domain-containing protein [Rickettsiella sp.]
MFPRSIVFIVLLLFFISQNSIAQTATGALGVTATVAPVPSVPSTCVLDSVTSMIFPNYNPLDAHSDDATALITMTCNAGISYDIGINEGHGSGATESNRSMTEVFPEATGLLPYGLFQNSNHTDNWGDILGKDTVHMEGNDLPQQLTVYGQISTDQMIEPGIYMDEVTIIVTF